MVHVGQDKILLSKIDPIKNLLNFNGYEFKKVQSRVETLEETVKALKSQINSVNTKVKENIVILDVQEQYMQCEYVEIKGIPVSEDEVTSQIIVQVADLLDVNMGLEDISSHRLLT